jgi:hypothetical protein
MLGDRPGLVALQRADEMPFEIEAGKRRDLRHSFLHIVFAEGALPGRHRLVACRSAATVLLTASRQYLRRRGPIAPLRRYAP